MQGKAEQRRDSCPSWKDLNRLFNNRTGENSQKMKFCLKTSFMFRIQSSNIKGVTRHRLKYASTKGKILLANFVVVVLFLVLIVCSMDPPWRYNWGVPV